MTTSNRQLQHATAPPFRSGIVESSIPPIAASMPSLDLACTERVVTRARYEGIVGSRWQQAFKFRIRSVNQQFYQELQRHKVVPALHEQLHAPCQWMASELKRCSMTTLAMKTPS